MSNASYYISCVISSLFEHSAMPLFFCLIFSRLSFNIVFFCVLCICSQVSLCVIFVVCVCVCVHIHILVSYLRVDYNGTQRMIYLDSFAFKLYLHLPYPPPLQPSQFDIIKVLRDFSWPYTFLSQYIQ